MKRTIIVAVVCCLIGGCTLIYRSSDTTIDHSDTVSGTNKVNSFNIDPFP